MKYILDTNICIYLMKHKAEVLEAFEANKNDGMAISAITLAELEYGVYKSSFYEKNKNKLISFLTLVEVLAFNENAALAYGKICATLCKQSTPISTMDMLIAAHAKAEVR